MLRHPMAIAGQRLLLRYLLYILFILVNIFPTTDN